MIDYINHILDKISFLHLNVLFLLGLALFGGAVGGRIFQKAKIPQVVGYIIIGMLIGESGFKLVDRNTIAALSPFNYFALGLIGFMVGGELKKEVFSKYGKHFTHILLCEGITPFLSVTIFIGIVGTFLFGPSPSVWALAILLGAIASATDPATTTSVLKEYKTRGPLTSNILGIVALDDGLALLLFAIASSIASGLVGHGGGGVLRAILHPLYEIGGAILLGGLSGFFLSKILIKYSEKERMLAFSIGTVLLVIGLSVATGISMLLAVMTLGIIITNLTYNKSKEILGLVEGFTPPIYVLFFVLVGAKLEFSNMTTTILALVVVYLIFGMTGKMLGAYIGAKLSKAPRTVVKYLPFSLFSQAGIAIGLSILAAQHFSGENGIGGTLVIIITATTFATQLIGPFFTKFAVIKAGEAGLNITEEDISKDNRARDLMDKNPPLIYENTHLKNILKIFSENDNISYPVVDKDKKLKGIITVEGIKQTFMEMDATDELILAHDVMEPVIAYAASDVLLSDVKEIIARHDTECLPIVNDSATLEGFIERKKLNKFISTKIIELQEKADSLDRA